MQYTEKFFSRKNGKFPWKNVDFLMFFFFFQNIDFGYTLELPRRGGFNEYPQSMFWIGMSFGVRFTVRTFGNKHPDGSNVRIFRIRSYHYMYVHTHVC